MEDDRLEFWQALVDRPAPGPPYDDRFTVAVGDRKLDLKLRPLPGGTQAVASFLANQASFAVHDAILREMGLLARGMSPEIVVGLPTLGLSLASGVARACGHSRFVPLGYSRKFWYDEALSTEIGSITSPDAGKRLYLDPHLLFLLRDRRVALVDDVVSSGRSIRAALELLSKAGIVPAGVVCAMTQTRRWQTVLEIPVYGVFHSPLFTRSPDGWVPVEGT